MNEQHILDFRQYENCRNFVLDQNGVRAKTNASWNFYRGIQWGDNHEGYPTVNFIEPIVQYKLATICMQQMSLYFETAGLDSEDMLEGSKELSKKMNKSIADIWEKGNLDAKVWDLTEEALVSGLVAAYLRWDDENKTVAIEIKSSAEILFADESQIDVQKQSYIFLPYRDTVRNVRSLARANGVDENDVLNIVGDEETLCAVGDKSTSEVEQEDELNKKVQCVIKLWKEGGTVLFKLFVESCEIIPATDTKLKNYPIAIMPCNREKGSVRGVGEVYLKIANQIEVNKHFARRSVVAKQTSYPKIVYSSGSHIDPDAFDEVGAKIEVEGNVEDIHKLVGYLTPPQMGTDSANLSAEIISMTKENAGASDAALGNVNPEQASGKALLAVKDAAAVPLTRQTAYLKQIVEEIGRIMWEIVTSQHVKGIEVNIEKTTENGESFLQKEKISHEEILEANLNLKVEVSPKSPFSKFAKEMSLENAMMSGLISLEEYAEALDDDANAPKVKLLEIVDKRKKDVKLQYENAIRQLAEENQALQMQMQQILEQNSLLSKVDGNYQALTNQLPALAQKGKEILESQGIDINKIIQAQEGGGEKLEGKDNASLENQVEATLKPEN